MLEIILGTDSKLVISAVFFSNFKNAISPVICAFWIFGIVNREVGDDKRMFEILCEITSTMTNQTVAKISNEKFSFTSQVYMSNNCLLTNFP